MKTRLSKVWQTDAYKIARLILTIICSIAVVFDVILIVHAWHNDNMCFAIFGILSAVCCLSSIVLHLLGIMNDRADKEA